ncbi:MAG: Lpg0189 family type II secretion system effector [Legionella longbeachae]|nr:Lpg0189 family type II secretion system effector [Legionella longbeachae]
MKINYLVTPLILFPLCAFSDSLDNVSTLTFFHNQESKNTQIITYSNEAENFKKNQFAARGVDYPTQIIRMDEKIENQQITCNEVHNQIDKILVQNIVNEKFTYAIFISCRYDPETKLATQFIINSYFDPLSDEAITYLEAYLSEYNNFDLLGTKFKIESAKGLIISLNIAAGIRKKPYKPPFNEYRKDRSNFYFKSNYEMKNKLYTDILQNFFTNDKDKILPFLDKWMFSYAGSIYKTVLRDSNYVELQPERIFIMDNENIFVSGLKQYFIHYCEQYDNHRCLDPT